MDIGYARVSTKDQILDRQLDELTAAGCDQIYSEKASGKKGADRPQWDRCLATLRQGDRLVVVELSRLGRHLGELAKLSEELQERGIGLKILNLGIDTTTPAGKLIFNIVAAVAVMERELLIERTHSGLAAARAKGNVGGRRRSITDEQIKEAQELYDERRFSMEKIARVVGVSPATLYRYLKVGAQ
ncbi:DNA invertase Pin-like site-specific DNA recombinase [Leucobacter exalbidus]|uniref:DNA invertase Pin-like site-specific DNA recombinase n=1 Tax=Leucobacter exalbidus TaxID=662960 RepID=A0A940PTR1_9MICO|nr:recombinase family protein [Leucobacter exalbidus]MBP1325056.1 DNA invertase Pin-like site-specific DNA recombinase [Leucobacter exalbidus]